MVEVTTYRSDAYDRTTRKPEVAFGDNLADDLVRRDFTVNAMALRLPSLEFVDPHDGLADLAARVLRTPGTPQESFADDPLRMMRAARFVSQLGFARGAGGRGGDDRDGRPALDRLGGAGPGRAGQAAAWAPARGPGCALLVRTGLADQVLPELPALALEIDEHHRHKDVYEHSLTVLEQAIALEGPPDGPEESVPGPDLVLRLAALLHDIGKPPTRRFEDGGGVSFHHHEVVGAKMAAKRLKALRFDKDTVKAVARLVELHLRFHGYGNGEWTDSAVRRYVTDAGPLLPRLHRLTRSDCTTRNQRKAQRLSRTYDELEARIARLQSTRRSWPRSGPSWTATRSPRCSASRPARCSAGRTSTCCRCGWTRGRSGRRGGDRGPARVVGHPARERRLARLTRRAAPADVVPVGSANWCRSCPEMPTGGHEVALACRARRLCAGGTAGPHPERRLAGTRSAAGPPQV